MNTSITYACSLTGCNQQFTSVEQLNVHLSNHELLLRLEHDSLTPQPEFITDQTPTPTGFIKSCEEVGLFADLQNVNPFDETFKTATQHDITEITNLQPPQATFVGFIEKLPNVQPSSNEQKTKRKPQIHKFDAIKRKEDILIRNRAAVHRSRIRKKERQKALEAEFSKIFETNKQLTEQNKAYTEIFQKYMHLFSDEDKKIFSNFN